MKYRIAIKCAFAGLIVLAAGVLQAATMTNDDIVKMVKARLDQAIIISSIESSAGGFDVSADGLIALSAAKVPKPIIEKMIERSSGSSGVAKGSPSNVTASNALRGGALAPNEIILIDGGTSETMRYTSAQVRSKLGVMLYAVMRGSAAALRVSDADPEFLISIPKQAQPDAYMTLASFAVRKNNSREVVIGGGYLSMSTGIHPERIVQVRSEPIGDQSKAQDGFIIYSVKPANPLPAGEYAFVLNTSESSVLLSAFFSGGAGNAYFDFGVD